MATPCYNAEGCAGPTYISHIVVTADNSAASIADLFGQRAAINGWDSQSGMSALRASPPRTTGTAAFFPRSSSPATTGPAWPPFARGRADVAAIDCVFYAAAARHAPAHLMGLRILTASPPVPSLPYVTALSRDDDTVTRLRAGLKSAIADPLLAAVRDDLLIEDFAVLEAEDYASIDAMEREAAERGYPQIG